MAQCRPHDRSSGEQDGMQKKLKSAVPSLAELGSLTSGGSAGWRAVYGTDGSVHLYIQQYCSDGSVYQKTFDPVQLLAVQPRCHARPNPLYKINKVLEMYGESVKQQNPEADVALGMAELQSKYRMVYRSFGRKQCDSDAVGFWCSASATWTNRHARVT